MALEHVSSSIFVLLHLLDVPEGHLARFQEVDLGNSSRSIQENVPFPVLQAYVHALPRLSSSLAAYASPT